MFRQATLSSKSYFIGALIRMALLFVGSVIGFTAQLLGVGLSAMGG